MKGDNHHGEIFAAVEQDRCGDLRGGCFMLLGSCEMVFCTNPPRVRVTVKITVFRSWNVSELKMYTVCSIYGEILSNGNSKY